MMNNTYEYAEQIVQKIITEANNIQKEHIWYKTNRMRGTIKKLLDQGIKEDELIYLLHNRLDYIQCRGFSMHNFTFTKIYNKNSLSYIKTIRHLNRQAKYEK